MPREIAARVRVGEYLDEVLPGGEARRDAAEEPAAAVLLRPVDDRLSRAAAEVERRDDSAVDRDADLPLIRVGRVERQNLQRGRRDLVFEVELKGDGERRTKLDGLAAGPRRIARAVRAIVRNPDCRFILRLDPKGRLRGPDLAVRDVVRRRRDVVFEDGVDIAVRLDIGELRRPGCRTVDDLPDTTPD